jgi:hypothetical protein
MDGSEKMGVKKGFAGEETGMHEVQALGGEVDG